MTRLEKAVQIASKAHEGQKDKAGKPYILHPLRVMLAMEDETEMTVAVLHDVVEDTPWTIEQLRDEDFPENVIQAIDCLTQRDGESYDAFIERVRNHPVAAKVKIADLEDNMDADRLDDLCDEDLSRIEKYKKARARLSER